MSDVYINNNGYIVDAVDKLGVMFLSSNELNLNRCGRLWNALLDHSPLLHPSGRGQPGINYFVADSGTFIVSNYANDLCTYELLSDPSIQITYSAITGKFDTNI